MAIVMSEEEKWQAIFIGDSNFDGSFFYGVKTTGIFCRPSCKSKNPKRENVVFFKNAQEARNYGLRPCKRCRPDLLEFQPQKEAAANIKEVYDQYFSNYQLLQEKLQGIGLSRNRMIQLFQQQYDKTPVEYLNALRIEHAKQLLVTTKDTILQIALLSGFESLSNFYLQFRRSVGVTPKQYREVQL